MEASRNPPGCAPKSATSDAQPSAVIEELIGSLCGQIEAAEDKAARWGQELMAARKRANEAERKAAELIEALRPFALAAGPISDFWDGERRINTLTVSPLRVMHLRRALALCVAHDAANPLAPQADSDKSRAEP